MSHQDCKANSEIAVNGGNRYHWSQRKAINEAPINKWKEIAIKQEPLNPSFIPVSTLHHTWETAETKPKVTPTHIQDNPDSLPTMVPMKTQQWEDFAIKQEIDQANSLQNTFKRNIRATNKLADQTSRS